MIFATAGTQLPFDRFVEALDRIAPLLSEPLVVQALPGRYVPRNFELIPLLSRVEFERHVRECSMMIAHAGIGSVVTSLSHSRPLVVFPRRASLGEHRSEHQLSLSQRFAARGYVRVAHSEKDLKTLLCSSNLPCTQPLPESCCTEISTRVLSFIKKS